MKHPRIRLKVWGKVWTVCFTSQSIRFGCDRARCYGLCDPDQRIIWVTAKGRTMPTRKFALIHELVHATLHEIYLDEAGVDRVATNVARGLDTPFVRLNDELRRVYKSAQRLWKHPATRVGVRK